MSCKCKCACSEGDSKAADKSKEVLDTVKEYYGKVGGCCSLSATDICKQHKFTLKLNLTVDCTTMAWLIPLVLYGMKVSAVIYSAMQTISVILYCGHFTALVTISSNHRCPVSILGQLSILVVLKLLFCHQAMAPVANGSL